MMFGLISSNGPASEPRVWHALKSDGGDWVTCCTAMSARPNLQVITTAPEPGPVTCRLKRCEWAIEEWEAAHTAVL
jgi:hypothetical protein